MGADSRRSLMVNTVGASPTSSLIGFERLLRNEGSSAPRRYRFRAPCERDGLVTRDDSNGWAATASSTSARVARGDVSKTTPGPQTGHSASRSYLVVKVYTPSDPEYLHIGDGQQSVGIGFHHQSRETSSNRQVRQDPATRE